MRFQVNSIALAGTQVLPDGTAQTRLNVNFAQIADPNDLTPTAGNNLNLNMSEDDARNYEVGEYYNLTLERDTTVRPVNEVGAQQAVAPVVPDVAAGPGGVEQ